MNRSTLRNLGIVLFALIAILIALEFGDHEQSGGSGQPLFDDMKSDINDIEQVRVESRDEETVVVRKTDDGWVLSNRDDFPADVATVREVLLALADARVLEQKTADPERYEALGVREPEADGSAGVRLTASGGGRNYAVIIGNTAQGSNRYVRIDGDVQSLLIDTNPELPEDVGGWLARELVDIDTANVHSVVIEHADGETLRIGKDVREDADFSVAELPEGRELSYPTVANSIGGALNDLELEDLRPAGEADPDVNTTVTTFDGLQLRVRTYRGDEQDDATWIALEAVTVEPPPGTDAEAAEETGNDSPEARSEDGPETTDVRDIEAVAADINARSVGREFRIPGYKANQLTRRWDDILRTESADDEE